MTHYLVWARLKISEESQHSHHGVIDNSADKTPTSIIAALCWQWFEGDEEFVGHYDSTMDSTEGFFLNSFTICSIYRSSYSCQETTECYN